MVISTKISKGIEYLYFQAGKDTLYIGPKDKPEKSKEENVIRALEHISGRLDHYGASYAELLPLLTPEMRNRYVEKELDNIGDRITTYKKYRSARSKG